MEFGIALSGGGIRGAAHVGVLLALEEGGMLPAAIAGTSAGSIVAGLYAAGYSPAALRTLVKELAKDGYRLIDPDYIGFFKSMGDYAARRSSSFSGLLKGKKLENYLCGLTDGIMISDVAMKIVIPAVDLNSGTTIVYSNAASHEETVGRLSWEKDITLCLAMRASSSVPAVFRPVMTASQCLVDGGVTDILPVDLLVAAGTQKVIGVDISENYSMPENHDLVEIGSHSFSVMGSRLRSYVSHQECFSLKVELPDSAGLFSFADMEECMDIGYRTAKSQMSRIKRYLSLCQK